MRTVAQALWRWSSGLLRVSMQVAMHEPVHDTGGYLVPHGQPMHHGFVYISAIPGRKWFTRTLLILMGLVVFWIPAAVLGLLALVAFALALVLESPVLLLRRLSRSDTIVPHDSEES